MKNIKNHLITILFTCVAACSIVLVPTHVYAAPEDPISPADLANSYDGDTWAGTYGWGDLIAISFDANTGEGTLDDILITPGDDTVLPESIPFTKDGYWFLYYTENEDGTGTQYAPGSTVSFDHNTILYAQWLETPSPTGYDGNVLAITAIVIIAVIGFVSQRIYKHKQLIRQVQSDLKHLEN